MELGFELNRFGNRTCTNTRYTFLFVLKEFVETSVVKVDACECVIRGLSLFLAFEMLVE